LFKLTSFELDMLKSSNNKFIQKNLQHNLTQDAIHYVRLEFEIFKYL